MRAFNHNLALKPERAKKLPILGYSPLMKTINLFLKEFVSIMTRLEGMSLSTSRSINYARKFNEVRRKMQQIVELY